MPLTDEEHIALLAATRRLLQEYGLGAEDERIALRLRRAETPLGDLVTFLELLVQEFTVRTGDPQQRTLGRLREVARAEGRISGIRLDFTREEARRYEVETLRLDHDPNSIEARAYRESIAEIRTILNDLREDHDERLSGLGLGRR